jgi:hypothetical protein
MIRRLMPVAFGLLAGCGGPAPAPVVETVVTGDVSNPTLARAADGGVYVAWVGTDSTGSNIWMARRAPDGAISAPVRVNDRLGDGKPHIQAPPQVAAGAGSTVYVLWPNATPIPGRRFPASDLRFARSDDGGRTFAPTIDVNDDAGGPPAGHSFHNLAVADDGTIYVSWIDSRRRGLPEGAPMQHGEDDHDAAGDESRAPPAQPGASSSGDEGSDIRVAVSSDGGRTFSGGTVVDSAVCPCCRTSLVVAGRDVWVAWRKVFEGDVRDVVVAHSSDGGATFEAPVRVHADGWVYPGCPHAGPSLARTRDGTLHVTWYTGAEDRRGLHHATSRDGGRTFDAPTALQGDLPIPVSLAALASGGDRVWRVWEDKTGTEAAIVVAEVNGRATAVGTGMAPAIVGGPDGPTVAWLGQGAVLLAAIR